MIEASTYTVDDVFKKENRVKRTVTLLVMLFTMLLFTSIGNRVYARAAQQYTSSTLAGVSGGSAYAAFLKVPVGSTLASIGPLFPVSLGCNTATKNVSSSAASMTLDGVASSGTLVDQVVSTRTSTAASIQASATLQNVRILGGLISATTINSVASSVATSTMASSANNSTFVGLIVAGIPISGTPAPNTTIGLPGLGKVVLNEQSGPVNGKDATSISVTAIDVSITLKNTLKLPVGTHILIANAKSNFMRTSSRAIVSADAYGLFAFAKAGVVFVKSGPWAEATIGCTGGSKTVSTASVTIPNVGSTGTITDTASGQITASGSQAQSSSSVQQVTLLNGLITADLITTTAQATFNGSLSASATTSLTNLRIAGVLIAANPPPNTMINIANVGFVVVNEQTVSLTATMVKIKVNAIDLHITAPNVPGLPVGVSVVVAHSAADTSIY